MGCLPVLIKENNHHFIQQRDNTSKFDGFLKKTQLIGFLVSLIYSVLQCFYILTLSSNFFFLVYETLNLNHIKNMSDILHPKTQYSSLVYFFLHLPTCSPGELWLFISPADYGSRLSHRLKQNDCEMTDSPSKRFTTENKLKKCKYAICDF